jgi:hypothetical protein
MNPNIIIATDDTIHQIVTAEIDTYGESANLNRIDVSRVTNMSYLFRHLPFTGDISQWDVSKVTTMVGMFIGSPFNGDISQWNVSKVTDMASMFADSAFNGDISQWDVSGVKRMCATFSRSRFNGDISEWNVSKVVDMFSMFENSAFKGDLSAWTLAPYCQTLYMLKIRSHAIPPLLQMDSIASYRSSLDAMFGKTPNKWIKVIGREAPSITENHGVFLLLLPDRDPQTIHSALTRQDRAKLQMLYQLTGSVYESVIAWKMPRDHGISEALSGVEPFSFQ